MPRALGPRKIGKYPIEFKAKAVALSRLPGLEVRQVAELKRLRQVEQENRILKEELTLLKKAIRFCSERKQRSTPS
jgi:transposase